MSNFMAASRARKAAEKKGTDYRELSAMMCWDAVAKCRKEAQINYNRLRVGTPVRNSIQVLSIPEGAAIGFYRGSTLAHVMISIGSGEAAGNKNQCIGIGNPVGWEIINLKLNWYSIQSGVDVRYIK